MQKSTAESLTTLLLRHGTEQNDILALVHAAEPNDEFLRIRSMIGKTMAAIYLDALHPIFEEHPSLKPDNLI